MRCDFNPDHYVIRRTSGLNRHDFRSDGWSSTTWLLLGTVCLFVAAIIGCWMALA